MEKFQQCMWPEMQSTLAATNWNTSLPNAPSCPGSYMLFQQMQEREEHALMDVNASWIYTYNHLRDEQDHIDVDIHTHRNS